MRYVTGKSPIVSSVRPPGVAARYLERLPRAVRFWLDPRLMHRVDVAEIAAEIAESMTTRSERWRTDEQVTVESLRGTALGALERIQGEYLGMAAVQFPSLFLRLAELPRVDPSQLAERLLRRADVSTGTDPTSFCLRIQRAFNSLSSHHREILAMRHFERLSPQEIADATRLKPREVAHRYRRALVRFTAKLRHDTA